MIKEAIEVKVDVKTRKALDYLSRRSGQSVEEYINSLIQKETGNINLKEEFAKHLKDKGVSQKTLIAKIIQGIYTNILANDIDGFLKLFKQDRHVKSLLSDFGIDASEIDLDTLMPIDPFVTFLPILVSKELLRLLKQEIGDPVLVESLVTSNHALFNELNVLCIMISTLERIESYMFEDLLGLEDYSNYDVVYVIKKLVEVLSEEEATWFYSNYCTNLILEKNEFNIVPIDGEIMKILQQDSSDSISDIELSLDVKSKLIKILRG